MRNHKLKRRIISTNNGVVQILFNPFFHTVEKKPDNKYFKNINKISIHI